MGTITHHFIGLCLLLFITGCSTNDVPVAPKIGQLKVQPGGPTPPQDQEVEGMMEVNYTGILRGFEGV